MPECLPWNTWNIPIPIIVWRVEKSFGSLLVLNNTRKTLECASHTVSFHLWCGSFIAVRREGHMLRKMKTLRSQSVRSQFFQGVVTLQGVRVGPGASAYQLVDKEPVSRQWWSGRTWIDGVVLKDRGIKKTDCLSEPDHRQGLVGGLRFPSTPLSFGF